MSYTNFFEAVQV